MFLSCRARPSSCSSSEIPRARSSFTQDAIDEERAKVLYRLGESARRVGDVKAAEGPLEEATTLDPTSTAALKSLALVYGARGNWEVAIRTMYRQLETEAGEDRIQLLLDIGDLAAEKLKDPSYAAKSYLSALGEKPNDRRILSKLMQLYSAEKDWDRLVKVVLNGKVVQEDLELQAPTGHAWRLPEVPRGPLMLQADHGPVAFRNIRVRRLD